MAGLGRMFDDSCKAQKWPKERISVSHLAQLAAGVPLAKILEWRTTPFAPTRETNIGSSAHAVFSGRLDDVVVIPDRLPLAGKGITKEVKAENEAFNASLEEKIQQANEEYKTPVSESEYETGHAMAMELMRLVGDRVTSDTFARSWALGTPTTMIFEQRFLVRIEGVWVSGSIDALYGVHQNADGWGSQGWGLGIGDLKTGASMDADSVSKKLGTSGYVYQLAAYGLAAELITRFPVIEYKMPVVESSKPYVCGLYTVNKSSIDTAVIDVMHALEIWRDYVSCDPDEVRPSFLNYRSATVSVPVWWWKKGR